MRLALVALLGALEAGCVVVPQAQRRYLADPTMLPSEGALENESRDKLHSSREAASGANGKPAGGGCACSN